MLQDFSFIFSLIILSPLMGFSATEVDFSAELQSSNGTKELQFKPSKGHHFNLQAPSQVEKIQEQQTSALHLKLESTSGSVAISDLDPSCQLNVELYICDDANSYCLPQTKSYRCEDLRNQKVVALAPVSTPTATVAKAPKVDEIFIHNDASKALEQARQSRKPMMIDFFGTWCPPCNVLDETVFNTKDFKKFYKDFVFLKLDGDDPASWELKVKYNVKVYPTIIFTNPQAEEISRILGSRPKNDFLKEMKLALKDKNLSFEERKKRAESLRSPEQTWAFGEMHWRQENTSEALKYFSLAAKKKKLTEKEKDLLQLLPLVLMAKSTDKDLQKQSGELLKLSLQSYPFPETFYEKYSRLTQLAEDHKDEALNKWIHEKTLSLVDAWLKNKRQAIPAEFTYPELWLLKATAFEELKMENEAKEAYKKGAEAYSQLIRTEKLNPESSRGYNITRIWAIYKSGDFVKADQLYSQMQKIYPQEFTFFYNHAQVLKERKQPDLALAKAESAYKYSYGDNKLRVVYLLAELQAEKGDKNKATQLLDETIKTTVLPANENIRTHRHVARLKKLKDSFSEKK